VAKKIINQGLMSGPLKKLQIDYTDPYRMEWMEHALLGK